MFLYGTVKSVEGRERVIRRCSFILNLMAAVCLAGFMLSNTGAERERIYQDAIKARNSKIAETRKALERQNNSWKSYVLTFNFRLSTLFYRIARIWNGSEI